MPAKSITVTPGEVYGKLTVINEVPFQNPRRVLCACVCGTQKVYFLHSVTSGNSTTCGCIKGTHRLSKHTLYQVWINLVRRCVYPSKKDEAFYAGRGITVCESWKNVVAAFIHDMYPGYKRGLQLDRIDNNGPYCKENCRWVTPAENCRNKRNNVWISIDGTRMVLNDAAKFLGVPRTTLRLWLRSGKVMVFDNRQVSLSVNN